MNRDNRGRFVSTPEPSPIPPRWPIYDALVAQHKFDPIKDRTDHAIKHARKERTR